MVEGSELYIASGLGHRRILRDEEVVSRVVDFLRAWFLQNAVASAKINRKNAANAKTKADIIP